MLVSADTVVHHTVLSNMEGSGFGSVSPSEDYALYIVIVGLIAVYFKG